MENLILVTAIAALIIAILAGFFLVSKASRPTPSPYIRKKLLTDHERAFFPKLENAARRLGGYRVFPQIAMAAVMDTRDGLSQTSAMGIRNTFDRKIVDFVIVDANMHVVMLVELDDRTHNATKDARRDEITTSAGYATARFRNGRKTTSNQIEDELRRIWQTKVNK